MSTVLIDIADGIATVTLNRPDSRNALNPELAAAFPAAITQCDNDDSVHAIILTGAGAYSLDARLYSDGKRRRW
jgi:enoyl-CoA hydratase/carnithine racemase